jgi:hypothetical protein
MIATKEFAAPAPEMDNEEPEQTTSTAALTTEEDLASRLAALGGPDLISFSHSPVTEVKTFDPPPAPVVAEETSAPAENSLIVSSSFPLWNLLSPAEFRVLTRSCTSLCLPARLFAIRLELRPLSRPRRTLSRLPIPSLPLLPLSWLLPHSALSLLLLRRLLLLRFHPRCKRLFLLLLHSSPRRRWLLRRLTST